MYWIMGASGLLSSLYPNVDDHQSLFESFVQAWNSHQLQLPHRPLEIANALWGYQAVYMCEFERDKIPPLMA